MDKIEQIYDTYFDIVKLIGKDKIQRRFADIHEMYNIFISEMEIVDKVKFNSYILMHALMDYFTDITRLKDFHKIEYTNKYKCLAYEISWLLKRKPIQILEESEDLVYINEKFLLSYTLNFLSEGLQEDNIKFNGNEEKRFNGFVESYYYYLKYRECTPQALEMIFLSFDAGKLLNDKK